jgi:hypothetical protein
MFLSWLFNDALRVIYGVEQAYSLRELNTEIAISKIRIEFHQLQQWF